jgi:hypothetical protein
MLKIFDLINFFRWAHSVLDGGSGGCDTAELGSRLYHGIAGVCPKNDIEMR